MLINWKTSLAGIGAICTAAGLIIHMYVTGMWDPVALGQTLLSVIVGFGLIQAKDA